MSAQLAARAVLAASTLGAVLPGCTASFFTCSDPQDCADGDAPGTCEPSGWCSFPDDACPSGSRYGELAGDGLAGECVDTGESDGTTESTSTFSGPSSTSVSTTLTSSTADPPTSEGSSSGGPISLCGNGELEDGEACDDANTTPGDGCSELCQPSGSLIWQQTIGRDEGVASALGVWDDGQILVGFSVALGGVAVPGLWRAEPEQGEVVWTSSLDAGAGVETVVADVDIGGGGSEQNALVIVQSVAMVSQDARMLVVTADGDGQEIGAYPGNVVTSVVRRPDGIGYIAGVNQQGRGFIRAVDDTGAIGPELPGEPYMSEDAFPLDLWLDGDVVYVVGSQSSVVATPAFFAATVGEIEIRHQFTPGTDNFARSVGRDPVDARLWIGGESTDFGGWVASVNRGGIELEPIRVTGSEAGAISAIAVDLDGSAIAVGSEGAEGARNGRVVRIAPSGDLIWSGSYPTRGDDVLVDVAIGANGEVFVSGTRAVDGAPRAWFARLVP